MNYFSKFRKENIQIWKINQFQRSEKMEGYLHFIVSKLTIEELSILGILNDKDATAAFKAIRRSLLFKESKLSTATFRKTVDKLTATQFLKIVTGGKEGKLYLSYYGQKALQQSLEEVASR